MENNSDMRWHPCPPHARAFAMFLVSVELSNASSIGEASFVSGEKKEFRYRRVWFRWKKDNGEDMETTVVKTPSEWIEWFTYCLKHIKKHKRSPHD